MIVLLFLAGCGSSHTCGSVQRRSDMECPCVTTAERVPTYGSVACRPDQEGRIVGPGVAVATARGALSAAEADAGGSVLLCTCGD